MRDLRGVTAPVPDTEDARVAARPLRVARRDRLEQLADDALVGQLLQHEPARVERGAVRLTRGDAALGDGDQPLDERPQLLRLRHGGFDALVPDERHRLVAQQRRAVLADASQLPMCKVVSHSNVLPAARCRPPTPSAPPPADRRACRGSDPCCAGSP